MKHICLYFQVHQPYRLKNFRFFNIGQDHAYYNDKANESILNKIAEKCYLPTNQILLDLIQQHKGKFKVSFSISGIALEQFEKYNPTVLKSFKALAETGHVDFLCETYAHSLASVRSVEEFKKQVLQHKAKIESLFGIVPTVFRNTELIYADFLGNTIKDLGFNTVITEGTEKILDWQSPNFLYQSAQTKNLNILFKNFQLSDDIAFRFSQQSWSEYPLNCSKFTSWINHLPQEQELVNLFMDYETFGEHQWADTGIFEFLKHLPKELLQNGHKFITPTEASSQLKPINKISIPFWISWADHERDLSAWLGNTLQQDAFDSLYNLENKVQQCKDTAILNDWKKLQTSDHFYYMSTKKLSDGEVHSYFSPYTNPHEAFINYMNVLADFEYRIDQLLPKSEKDNNIPPESLAQFASFLPE